MAAAWVQRLAEGEGPDTAAALPGEAAAFAEGPGSRPYQPTFSQPAWSATALLLLRRYGRALSLRAADRPAAVA